MYETVGMAAWETASLHHSLDVLILTTDSPGAGPAHPETVRQSRGRSQQVELGKTFFFVKFSISIAFLNQITETKP